jgi:hypothetical protein
MQVAKNKYQKPVASHRGTVVHSMTRRYMCSKDSDLWIVNGEVDNAKTVAVAVVPPSWDSIDGK